MDTISIRDTIDTLDPEVHGALIQALQRQLESPSTEMNQTSQPLGCDDDLFESAFRKTVRAIKGKYINGTIDYVCDYHPELYQKTIQAKDRLDKFWKMGREGEASLEEFKAALDEWKSLHIMAIEIYQKIAKSAIQHS